MKVTDRYFSSGDGPIFICDFTPPRTVEGAAMESAAMLQADFICVAYNPGKRVRVDSAMFAAAIRRKSGKETVFNLGTRDMNKLALQSHLLGAQMLGLDNVLVVQGDPFTEKELVKVKQVSDYKSTELIAAIAEMNAGKDYKGAALETPPDICIGASIDLGRGVQAEAALTGRKAAAGAHYFVTQPVYELSEIDELQSHYRKTIGEDLKQPVFYGVQILEKDGIIFSSVPQSVRDALEQGRPGFDIAFEQLERLREQGIRSFYLVPPILRGGARNYEAANHLIGLVQGQ